MNGGASDREKWNYLKMNVKASEKRSFVGKLQVVVCFSIKYSFLFIAANYTFQKNLGGEG